MENIKFILLNEREKKFLFLKQFFNKYKTSSFITINLNIAFYPKNNKTTNICLKTILNYVLQTITCKNIKKIIYLSNFAGDSILVILKESLNYKQILKLKKKFYNFEIKYRIADIDLFFKNKRISYKDINAREKKCILCNNPYSLCRKENKHSKSELINAINIEIDKLINLNYKGLEEYL